MLVANGQHPNRHSSREPHKVATALCTSPQNHFFVCLFFFFFPLVAATIVTRDDNRCRCCICGSVAVPRPYKPLHKGCAVHRHGSVTPHESMWFVRLCYALRCGIAMVHAACQHRCRRTCCCRWRGNVVAGMAQLPMQMKRYFVCAVFYGGACSVCGAVLVRGPVVRTSHHP